jgi:hypothetical protein
MFFIDYNCGLDLQFILMTSMISDNARRLQMTRISVVLVILGLFSAVSAYASGHGPLFALSTPTNAHGQWSIDFATLTIRDQENTGAVFRNVLSYGITDSVMLSLSTPFIAGETESLTPALGSYEGFLTWRFQKSNRGIGSRYESIVFGGIIYPADQFGALRAIEKSAGFQLGGCTGLISRSHYLWGGVSYTAFQENDGDKRPNLLFYSFAWGHRPDSWRKDYPAWDWRYFIEATGEKFGDLQFDGFTAIDSNEHQIMVGPALLGQYKWIAVEAGFQVAVYRNTGLDTGERFRLGLTGVLYF